MEQAFRRPIFSTVLKRIMEPRRFIQVLAGPRQTGKTTLARQVMEAASVPSHYASADEPALRDSRWLQAQWEFARLRARDAGEQGALLILDEIHKLTGWSEVVKWSPLRFPAAVARIPCPVCRRSPRPSVPIDAFSLVGKAFLSRNSC